MKSKEGEHFSINPFISCSEINEHKYTYTKKKPRKQYKQQGIIEKNLLIKNDYKSKKM